MSSSLDGGAAKAVGPVQPPSAASSAGGAQSQQSSPGKTGVSNPLPSINLPKGGGAIRDIGEKFSVNAATGTGSTSVPIQISASRSGFGPVLSLSYDSGSGNGPFGFGWQLSLPSITRKTDKGLPTYQDATETDLFLLSGAEDLVPVLEYKNGKWGSPGYQVRSVNGIQYHVKNYQPRIEGAFSRIEEWSDVHSGESHWRTISKDNITVLYGESPNSRVYDPASAESKSKRIFRWLLSKSFDDKGNVFIYEYKAENSDLVDINNAHELNRTVQSRSAQRYVKRIKYGNRVSRLVEPSLKNPDWMFEIVFDYGEHADENPGVQEMRPWHVRPDPFSTYRSRFEVRTYRLCKRILMFHHFPNEPGIGQDCLVSSFEISYDRSLDGSFNHGNHIASFVSAITQRAYQHHGDGYLNKALPPVEFKYSQPIVSETVQYLDRDAIENLPPGVDDNIYRWLDLDGEGISGILTFQGGEYFYKPNLGNGIFGTMEALSLIPSLGGQKDSHEQWMDLAGSGHVDLVQFGGRSPGFYRRASRPEERWKPFQPFKHLPNTISAFSAAQYLDLTGDGLTDILVANDEVFTWYPSLGEAGYGPANYSRAPLDEENGPRLLVSDVTEAYYVADMSGDGLSDLVRIRNKEICYWPNVGYGQFGKKVAMDNSPCLDFPETFIQSRIRLFDIDGSGTTDLIYLSNDGACYYQNQAGNSWTTGRCIPSVPRFDNMSQVQVVDLLGNGTGCLVWSSKLPGDGGRQVRYVDLMGGQKPHLLISQANNLGSESRIHYTSSTHFYLRDKASGRGWASELAFPVHVVERVETFDYISKNHFISRYTYHDGFFDGVEREFHGFGMVEQFDTEEFASFSQFDAFTSSSNLDAASHVPPVLTKTWFHTGGYFEGERISRYNETEYFREAGLNDAEFKAMLLEDTILPDSIRVDGKHIPHSFSTDESRQACRALKGQQLRQEVYSLDNSKAEKRPYTVVESNFTVDVFQPRGPNLYAVFFTHPKEQIQFHYERKLYPIEGRQLADPRISHSVTLATDEFGNVLESASITYGRRHDDCFPLLREADRKAQRRVEIMHMKSSYTNDIFSENNYRLPLSSESITYQLFNPLPSVGEHYFTSLYSAHDVRRMIRLAGDGEHDIPYQDYEGKSAVHDHPYRRLIKHQRTLYSRNDLSGPLPLGQLQSMGIVFEAYHKAFSHEHSAQMYVTSGLVKDEDELSGVMKAAGYIHSEDDDDWWIPSGRVFYSPNSDDTASEELKYAEKHFFMALRFRDPFFSRTNKSEWFVSYDQYDLLMQESRDSLGNRVTVGERNIDPELPPTVRGHDYRLLVPTMVTDPNRNRAAIKYDILGLVIGSALMGKHGKGVGDSLEGLESDLSESTVEAHFSSPLESAVELLGSATARFVYDMYAFQRGRIDGNLNPTGMSAIVRTTHQSDLKPGEKSDFMLNFSYFDGFGRTIQQKVHAGPGPLYRNDPEQPDTSVPTRYICSGWTIYNNKGSAVRKYEPFYTRTHIFEFDAKIGVTSTMFYDPLERVVATLFPDDTWSKAVFDAWGEQMWDANDTILRNPMEDPDVGEYFRRLSPSKPFVTWYDQRIEGSLGPHARQAALKTEKHADTPTYMFLDSQGQAFLTIEHNRQFIGEKPSDEFLRDRTQYDIEGNKRAIIDAIDRKICLYEYDMLGSKIHQSSMEAGKLWMLHDVSSNLVFGWDSHTQRFRTVYDALRRSTEVFLSIASGPEKLVEKTIYGEPLEDSEKKNLRQKVVKIFDQAGIVISDDYDFKGNILSSQRKLAKEYKSNLDWSREVDFEEGEDFVNRQTYDAVNRKVSVTAADNSTTQYFYNDAGLLNSVTGRLSGSDSASRIVKTIQYNARGQRHLVEYGNGTTTTSTHDDLTFHLTNLVTCRSSLSMSESQDPEASWHRAEIQNLNYTYDPIGNVVHVEDKAQERIFFRNKRVDPSGDYTYDALYRLIESSGREQLGQAHHPSRKGFPGHGEHAHDGTAMARYSERYWYDLTGNILRLQHQSSDETHGSWTRYFKYEEPSQIEHEKFSNRLSQMTLGKETEHFSYAGDAGVMGNITAMSSISALEWDYKNQLSSSARQDVEKGSLPETTYYRYDARGQRVRKVTECHAKCGETLTVLKSRVYFGMYEQFRRYNPAGEVILERQSLRVMDDTTCLLLAETRTVGDDKSPQQLLRYQLGNHINSVAIELGANAEIITYEEYGAYGDTTYKASHLETGVPKRYGYSGKEKDEESGLYYYGARYYLPYIYRWISCDPGGLKDGPNLYLFVKCNPVSKSDPNGAEASWWNRATGALQVIGGALEIAAGAAGIAAPTGVTQVLGVVAVAHGLDTTWSGLKQVWTGEQQKTYTEQGATKLAEAAGASKETAEKIGMGLDIAVGIIPEAGIALAKGGTKLLAKAGGALKKAGTAIKDAAVGAKKLAIEAGHELAGAGKSVIRKVGEQVEKRVDQVKKVLEVVSDVKAELRVVKTAGGPEAMFDGIMFMMGDKGRKALQALKTGGKAVYREGMSASERLDEAVKAVQEWKGAKWVKKWAGETRWHHVFPQEFADFFKAKGINIHEFILELDYTVHKVAHGNWGYLTEFTDWNKAWAKWIAEHADASPRQVMNQMKKMMKEYGIDKYFKNWDIRYPGHSTFLD
jgi:RHS repeat-associated protein